MSGEKTTQELLDELEEKIKKLIKENLEYLITIAERLLGEQAVTA